MLFQVFQQYYCNSTDETLLHQVIKSFSHTHFFLPPFRNNSRILGKLFFLHVEITVGFQSSSATVTEGENVVYDLVVAKQLGASEVPISVSISTLDQGGSCESILEIL